MELDQNRLGYTISKLGALGIIFTTALCAFYYGYTFWGVIALCVDMIVGGLMLTNCFEDM